MRQAVLPDKAHLYEMELLRGLSAGDIARLHDAMQYRLFRRDDVLLAQGQSSKALFFLHQGVVKICDGAPETLPQEPSGRITVLNLVGPGALLGEVNALDGAGHSASVIALESAACFLLESERFHIFRAQMPQFATNFDHHLAATIRRQTTRYRAALQNDLTGKTANLLLHLAERFGVPEGAHCLIDVPLTHLLIGQMTGHSRENITKKIEAFEKNQWVGSRPDHRLVILNNKALVQCCR